MLILKIMAGGVESISNPYESEKAVREAILKKGGKINATSSINRVASNPCR